MRCQPEIDDLLRLSARIGRDPLLVQASSGNTSIKLNGTLWIKGSGKWLAHATENDMLVPLDVADLRERLRNDRELPAAGASIETAMHAALPHSVVIHVHSVNALSWAVRADGEQRVAERLAGLHWRWIPYVPSGVPLARMIEKAIHEAPASDVFVLANHGLVVCGRDCAAAQNLLSLVENALAVSPRIAPDAAPELSVELSRFPQLKLAAAAELQALGTDAVSRKILCGGILYPCQAVFLGTQVAVLHDVTQAIAEQSPFWVIEGKGVVLNTRITESQYAVLKGLFSVIQRVERNAPLRYLSSDEVFELLSADVHGYRQCAEKNAILSQRRVEILS